MPVDTLATGLQIKCLPGAGSDLAALHEAMPERYPALLESVAKNPQTGRYSLLLAFPESSLHLDHAGELWRDCVRLPPEQHFLDVLDQVIRQTRLPDSTELPFCGGYFVYFGYEFLREIEAVDIPQAPAGLPLAVALRIPAAIVVDHQENLTYLVAQGEKAHACMTLMGEDMRAVSAAPPLSDVSPPSVRVTPDDQYLAGVRRAKDYIRDGDVFQVNLSCAWEARYAEAPSPMMLYRRLRHHNPAPFAGFFAWRGCYVLSSSPERLLHLAGQTLHSRPIAGTRPRLAREDEQVKDELIGHPKERAEHIMLIDLIRNDLGRVCRPGSIAVNELMAVETYEHVHHIVSSVAGRPAPDVSPGRMVAALFPGGTITGCPKVRCMEIIAELEGAPRGAYTGSMGYISDDGKMDLNILIRSMEYAQGQVRLRAGAGIVADSEPLKELAECRAKAKGLLRALGLEENVTN